MNELISAYTKWPANYQLLFAAFLGVLATVVLILFGMWLLALIGRFWVVRSNATLIAETIEALRRRELLDKHGLVPPPKLAPLGINYQEEVRMMAEQQRLEAEARMPQTMEQVSHGTNDSTLILPQAEPVGEHPNGRNDVVGLHVGEPLVAPAAVPDAVPALAAKRDDLQARAEQHPPGEVPGEPPHRLDVSKRRR